MADIKAPLTPPAEKPPAEKDNKSTPRASGNSITLTLGQDLFDEVCKLIPPIAVANAMTTPIEDQIVTRKVTLLGNVEVATAKKIRIVKAEVANCKMPLKDGYIAVEVIGIHIVAEAHVKALKASLGTVIVTMTMDLTSKVYLRKGANGLLKTDIEDVVLNVKDFDTEIPVTIIGDALEAVTDFFESTIKGAISGGVKQPIDDALTTSLNSVLGRNLDFAGEVSGVKYLFKLEFSDPTVKPEGATVVLSIDSMVNPPPEEMPPPDPTAQAAQTSQTQAAGPPPVPPKT